MKDPASTRENYTMNLKLRADQWSVVNIDDGRSWSCCA